MDNSETEQVSVVVHYVKYDEVVDEFLQFRIQVTFFSNQGDSQ